MAFPPGFIEELKARNPIENIISRYVELRRAGSNMIGLCPFHSERTPSFTVFHDNFHCFGCSAGGDVITFVMRMENLEYREAIKHLAELAGMTLPDDSPTGFTQKAVLTKERAYEMNKVAARLFYDNLMSDEGRQAREYLIKRNLTRATCTHFGLGYSKNSFNDLLSKLTQKGYTVDEIKSNFLCGISQKNGKPFDMFRNRIMFPIIDTKGNIIAFGGRVMDDSKPKYLNSSDTVIFKKSRNLFALNFAKNTVLGDSEKSKTSFAKPGEIIICEGYMDVIALHQAGFSNAVATLGTAITPDHARIISQHAKTVYLSYDSDTAGQTATNRAIQLLTDVGIDAKVIKLSGAKDPDEYIKKFGASSFEKLLHASEGQVDYKLNTILSKYDITKPDDKIKAVSEACRMLAGIRSELKKEIYAARLSERIDVKIETINAEIKRNTRIENSAIRKRVNNDMQKKINRYDDKINPDALKYQTAVITEKRILGILMLYPEYFDSLGDFSSDSFVTEFNKNLFEKLCELYKSEAFNISALNEFYSPEQFSYILEMKNARAELTCNGLDALNEQITALKNMKNTNDNENGDFSESISKIRNQKLKGS